MSMANGPIADSSPRTRAVRKNEDFMGAVRGGGRRAALGAAIANCRARGRLPNFRCFFCAPAGSVSARGWTAFPVSQVNAAAEVFGRWAGRRASRRISHGVFVAVMDHG
jgi:hypothetical protein